MSSPKIGQTAGNYYLIVVRVLGIAHNFTIPTLNRVDRKGVVNIKYNYSFFIDFSKTYGVIK